MKIFSHLFDFTPAACLLTSTSFILYLLPIHPFSTILRIMLVIIRALCYHVKKRCNDRKRRFE